MCQLFLPLFSPSVLRLDLSASSESSQRKFQTESAVRPESQASVEIKFGGNSVRVCAQIGHVVTNLFSQLLYVKPSCTDGPSDVITLSLLALSCISAVSIDCSLLNAYN